MYLVVVFDKKKVWYFIYRRWGIGRPVYR